jgi:hypothetical protein
MRPAILLPLLAGLSISTWATVSNAEPVAEAESTKAASDKARELFNQARQLAGQALYDQACPLFEESLKLEPRVSTQFNLADCWEHQERTASARALFLRVAEITHQSGDAEKEQIARRRAEMLEPRLCAIEIDVATPAPGQTIQYGEKSLTSADWGSAVPVDPGSVEVRAEAPGKKAWTNRVDVAPCPTLVTLKVPELEDDPAAKAAEPAAAPTPIAEPARKAEAPREEPEPGGRSLVLPLSLAGLGVGGILGGVIFSERYRVNNHDAKEICKSGNGCTQGEIADHDRYVDNAKSARTWAYVGFGVGVAALTSAAIVYFTGESSSGSTAEKSWSAAPLVLDRTSAWGATLSRNF